MYLAKSLEIKTNNEKKYLIFHSSGDLQSIFASCLEHYCEQNKIKQKPNVWGCFM